MRRAEGQQHLGLPKPYANPFLPQKQQGGSISRSPNAGQEDNWEGVADAAVPSILWVAVPPPVTQPSRCNWRWPCLLVVRWWWLCCSVGDAAVLTGTRRLPGTQQGSVLPVRQGTSGWHEPDSFTLSRERSSLYAHPEQAEPHHSLNCPGLHSLTAWLDTKPSAPFRMCWDEGRT